MLPRLKVKFAEFLRDSEGSATIEFLLWMPLLTGIIAISADTAMFFAYRAFVMKVVDDANRAASVGRLMSESAAEDYVSERLGDLAEDATINVEISVTYSYVRTTVDIPIGDVSVSGAFEDLLDVDSLFVEGQRMTEGTV